ncbi:dynein axonemal intermediate chain 7 isoform X2 [Chelonia mydas]|uniref:dynein axonemal intermediate chain 7 isoform X2 n=1 Tax=Chelonia mydas TaxID=8469 RepID=UPI0018A1E8BA|nr:dynein axonemal intermediate chain 7 isoform X2 [Chelonia mydas]
MGPKKKTKSGGSGGQKKLSKAERLRLQKEEEDRRLIEEEEARLRAEQEEAERLEKERIVQEERERLEAKDQERRGTELAELHSLEENFLRARQWKADYRAHAKWEHYMQCDGSPDPAVPQEINTFMSLWQENKNEDIEFVIEKGNQVLNLIEKLYFLLLDTPPNELKEKVFIQYQESILELQSLLHQKYNEATERLLKKANTYADSDSGNMEVAIKDKNITFCIWGNLKKNPRFKNHMFSDAENGFDLPKTVATSDVAVRILHTHYDHISPLQCIPKLHLKMQAPESKQELTVLYDMKEEKEGEQKSGEDSDLVIEKESDGRKSAISFKDSIKIDPDENEKLEEESDKKSENVSTISGVQVAPLQVATDEKEEEIIGENVVDLHQFTPVGGVYLIDALKLPPQAKQIKGWTMVELLDVGLETYPYPPESEETEDATYPRIGVTLRLLDSVIFFEEPVVARWDSAGKQWRTDGISDIKYKMKEKQISFEMDAFYTITLIQDAHLNMPYQSWELRPNGTDELLFTVVTAFAEVQMQIKGNQCMLSSITVDGSEKLSHLTGKWTSPIDLTIALKKAGVNIFPSDYSYKYVCVNKKTPLAEVTTYQQMALVASAFAFSWSKWNLASGQDQVVFKVSEHLKTDAVKDEDWSLYMFNGQRAQRLMISETSEAFSEDLANNTEFHSTLYHLIKDFASEEAIEKVKKASCLFIDAVYQLLIATRVLTYS